MISLSIIIVSFNTKEVTSRCLISLKKNFKKYPLDYEVIVIDNGSKDSSLEMINKQTQNWRNLKVIDAKKNLGYGKANNLGLKVSKGKYILYLNSDAIVTEINFQDLISFIERDSKIGGLTVKVILQNGLIDPASHRGFPTPWASLTYFLGLEKLFGKVYLLNSLFGKYHLKDRNLKNIHEIDVPTGAFFLAPRKLLNKIGGFDQDYFAYGEDIELAYQIKNFGFKIFYYPLYEVLHLKSTSGLKKVNSEIREKTKFHFYDSMKIFYRKHYENKYPWIFNKLIYLAIDLKAKFSK